MTNHVTNDSNLEYDLIHFRSEDKNGKFSHLMLHNLYQCLPKCVPRHRSVPQEMYSVPRKNLETTVNSNFHEFSQKNLCFPLKSF
jgi:hypothetical protein